MPNFYRIPNPKFHCELLLLAQSLRKFGLNIKWTIYIVLTVFGACARGNVFFNLVANNEENLQKNRTRSKTILPNLGEMKQKLQTNFKLPIFFLVIFLGSNSNICANFEKDIQVSDCIQVADCIQGQLFVHSFFCETELYLLPFDKNISHFH